MRKKIKICLGCLREISLHDKICPFCGFDPLEITNPRYLRVGTRLAKRYVVGKEVGEGGFGITYIGYDSREKRPIAIKEYFPANIVSRDASSGRSQKLTCFDGKDGKYFQEGLERFKKEGKTLEKAAFCNHVVQMYDYFEENETGYIVMEYVPGITLQQRVENQGKFTPAEMYAVLSPLMKDLEKLHEKGLLHRDISPDNIILRPDGMAKLIDFGSARRTIFGEQGSQKSLTVVVRQQYAPREQFSRNGKQGPWTDIYSLAATMYFMLTGKAPASAFEREAEISSQKMLENMQQIPLAVADVLEEAMALKPEERYSDLSTFTKALEEVIPKSEEEKKIERTVYYNREKRNHKVLPLWKKKRIIYGAVIFVLLILGGIGIGIMVANLEHVKDVTEEVAKNETSQAEERTESTPEIQRITMPRLEGETIEEALQLVKQADNSLSVLVEKKYSEKKKGIVLSQSIAPGEQYLYREKQNITLFVSRGIQKVTVPDVKGKSLEEGKALLQAKGFRINVKKCFSKEPKNSIIKQKETKNRKVKKGSVIHLVVSKGSQTAAYSPSSATAKPTSTKPAATKKPEGIQIVTD